MSEKIFIGIDIGSTNSKLAILNATRELLGLHSIATGFSSKSSFDALLGFAREKFPLSEFKIAVTGYGRESIDCDKKITEIK